MELKNPPDEFIAYTIAILSCKILSLFKELGGVQHYKTYSRVRLDLAVEYYYTHLNVWGIERGDDS